MIAARITATKRRHWAITRALALWLLRRALADNERYMLALERGRIARNSEPAFRKKSEALRVRIAIWEKA